MGNGKQSSQVFDNLLFPRIFQTFRIAVQPSKLIIAFLAIAAISLAGWVMDFSKTVVATSGTQLKTTELQIYMNNPARVQTFIERFKARGGREGVFGTLWHFAAGRFNGTLDLLLALNLTAITTNIGDCFKAVGWALKYHFLYYIIFFLINLAVISIAGGAICRIAALQFAQGEKPGLTEALRFGIKKFKSLFTAPLVPLGIIIFTGLFIYLLGLIGNIPWVGELIVSIFTPLALLAGLLITIIAIGAVAGLNLMFPAVAYDGADCFDTISRSFSYVYAKPWRIGFYTLAAAVYGAGCYAFARLFAFLLLWLTRWFLQLSIWVNNSSKTVNKLDAIWPEPTFMDLLGSPPVLATTNWSESIAGFLIHLFALTVVGLLVSFVISFSFSANTIIYSLMRNRVDNTALEEIYTHSDDTKITEPTALKNGTEESQPQPQV